MKKFKIQKRDMESTQNILVTSEHKNLKYTKELKDINSKKKKTSKKLFLSLGTLVVCATTSVALTFLIKKTKS